MSDEDHEQPATAAPVDREAHRRPRALVVATAAAVVFALLAVALGLVAAGGNDGDPDVDAVRAAAGRFGEAFLSYDFKDPQAHRDLVESLSTGAFRSEYVATFDQGLGQVIEEVKASSKGFVKEVYVASIEDERALAIVTADVTYRGPGGDRTIYDLYFRLTFVEVGGTWKVDDVTDLNFDTAADGTGSEGPTSETTAPASGTADTPVP